MAQLNSFDDGNSPLAEILQKRTESRAREILGLSDRQLRDMARRLSAGTLERMIRGLRSQAGQTAQGKLAQQAADRLVDVNGLGSTDGSYPPQTERPKLERKA